MQRDNEWFDARSGRFTGSEIHKLMGVKGLGETGKTYIFEKACEIVFGRDTEEQFVTFDMKRGIELEPIAFKKFADDKSYQFIDVEPCDFFPYKDYAGASPDGLVGKDAVLEIKCPRPQKLFKLMYFGAEAIDKEYYWQMQMEMLCTNSVRCHFYNYAVYNGQEYAHEIVLDRNDADIELLKARMNEAVEIRDNMVNDLRTKINKHDKV